jgi:hypothetical protein
MIRLFLLAFIFVSASYAQNTPKEESDVVYGMAAARFFWTSDNFLDGFAEIKGTEDKNGGINPSVILAGRTELLPWLRGGVLYQRKYGVLHDFDWRKNEQSWHWRDTAKRGEDSIGIDLTARSMMTDSLIFETRFSFDHNMRFDIDTIKLRPGLGHLYFGNKGLMWRTYLYYEAHIPTNRDRKWDATEHWLYLGSLWHWRPNIALGPQATYRRWTAKSTKGFEATTGSSYSVTQSSYCFGLVANYTFK